jgi:hypothetical protein
MTQIQEVLQKVTEERVVREHVEALRRPLPSPFLFLLFLLSQAGLAAIGILTPGHNQGNRAMTIGMITFVAATAIWSLTKALRSRDRMWREVIRKEAPDLYAKIQKTDA